jgi:hypothetical protein
MFLSIAIFAAAAAVSPERYALGRELAQLGSVAAMLPVVELKETDELIEAHSELSAGERIKLRRIAHRVAMAGLDRIVEAEGRSYAEQLSEQDLRKLVGFARSEPALRMRRVEPQVARATLAALVGYSYKAEVMRSFCAETGKGCGGPPAWPSGSGAVDVRMHLAAREGRP